MLLPLCVLCLVPKTGGGSSKNEAHFGMYLEDLLNSLVEGTMDVAGFLNAYDDLRDNGFKENFLRRVILWLLIALHCVDSVC